MKGNKEIIEKIDNITKFLIDLKDSLSDNKKRFYCQVNNDIIKEGKFTPGKATLRMLADRATYGPCEIYAGNSKHNLSLDEELQEDELYIIRNEEYLKDNP